MAKAKEIIGLDCEAEAASGMRLVLLGRLEEMCEFRAAALEWSDDEGVHDMRVASRRLRSALRDFRPHLRAGRRLDAARAELKRLANALGAVRDEDVAISALEKLKEKADEKSASEGLELFADDRRARREGARVELVRALEQVSFESARKKIAGAFEKATAPRKRKRGDDTGDVDDVGGNGARSFRELGRFIVERSWDELRERDTDLYRPLKAGPLHDMRIAAKRLRYALELFAACFGDEAKELAHRLADLQTALGDLHDCDEWIKEFGQRLSEQRGAESEASSTERREAALWMLEHFVGERSKHYCEALAVWRGMEREGFASRLARCLDAAGRES
ncbi:MAG TPA: CHAD domain-containing protein [Pyrinomonadaceae bacterium]|nr:CHAD domain-containing protein [Pyrinomonadaceae bacterium]